MKSHFALAVLSACALAILVVLFIASRDAETVARTEALIREGWRADKIVEDGFHAEWIFRAPMEIALGFAAVLPLFLFFRRRSSSEGEAATTSFLAVALLVGTLLRLDLWWNKSFWGDCYALKAGLRSHSFLELLFSPLGFGQSAPVGFSLMERIMGELSGWSDHVLTVPLLAAGLAILFLFPGVSRRLGASRPATAAATILLAVSPPLVHYSGEFKQYGFDALFAMLSVLAAMELSEGRRPRSLLGAVLLLGPLFSHTQFFLLPVLVPMLLWATFRPGGAWRRPDGRAWRDLAVFAGGCTILTLLSFLHTTRFMPGMMFDFWARAFPPTDNLLDWASWWGVAALRFFRNPLRLLPVPADVSRWNAVLFLPVPALLLAGLWPRTRRQVWFLLLGIGGAVALVLASSLKKWPVLTGTSFFLESRHLLFLFPFAFLALAVALSRLSNRTPAPVFALLAVALPVATHQMATDRIFSWSMPDAVRELKRRAVDGSPILMGGHHAAVCVAYEPVWKMENDDRITVFENDRRDVFAARLDELALAPGDGFWLLYAQRGREGALLPDICREHLPGFHADFVRRTPAGVLQHFPAPPRP